MTIHKTLGLGNMLRLQLKWGKIFHIQLKQMGSNGHGALSGEFIICTVCTGTRHYVEKNLSRTKKIVVSNQE